MSTIIERGACLGNALPSLLVAGDIVPGDSVARFYVYALFRADGSPCYVGKGTGVRHTHHVRLGTKHYNPRLAALFGREGKSVRSEIVFYSDDETIAFRVEELLIAALRSDGHDLCNMTAGGAGSHSAPKPEEHRKKIGDALRGRKQTPRPPISDETRAKRSASIKLYHASRTPEQRAARAALISQTTRAGMASDEVRDKCGSSHRGKPVSDEMREKNRQGQLRRWGNV